MKILICVRRLDKGGAELLECRLAQNLNEMGVHTDLAGQYDKNQFDGAVCAAKWNESGVPKIVWLKSNQSFGVLVAIVRLIRIIWNNRYDVIISHHSGLDIIAGAACFLTRTKHVAAFHDYFYKEQIGKFRILIWRSILSKASVTYCISNYVKHNIQTILNVNEKNNRTIYNSIETPVLKRDAIKNIRQELNLAQDTKLILSSGRVNFNKGFDLSILVLKDLLLKGNNYLLIMGGASNKAEDDYLRSLMDLVTREGLSTHVLFLGYRKEAFAILQQSNVYIHMARHEGFGLVLTEAIAAGVPIVASNAGGIPEVLSGTSYTAFSLMDKTGIVNEVTRFLALSAESKKELTDKATDVLPFYTDKRRAQEVKKMLEEIVV